jgi:hypothetical protein
MASEFKKLKKNQVPLTPEERAECINRKAVWHNGIGKGTVHATVPAVWKSVNKKTGKVTYITNTHRAFNTAPTLKGAIGRFHSFIKSTAGEEMNGMIKIASLKWHNIYLEIEKQAQDENDFDSNGKIPALEKAFSDPIAKKVAYMIATSHEYKKPNVSAALSFVKNYKWELSEAKVIDLQGINKPVIKEKVFSMAKSMKGKKPEPLITVNQFQGIRPQTPGKKILIDGHHRLEALKFLGEKTTPIYKGTYTGAAEKPLSELKVAEYKEGIYKRAGAVLGAAVGIPAGGVIGYKAGRAAAHLIPMSKEMKQLNEERKNLKNQGEKLEGKYDGILSDSFNKKDFQTYLKQRPDYDKLTVSQVEDIAENYLNNNFRSNLSKTASSKNALGNTFKGKLKKTLIGAAVTGIPTGIMMGIDSFKSEKKDRTDKEYASGIIEKYKKDIDYFNNQLSGKNKVNFKEYMANEDHAGEYSPSSFMPGVAGIACEGEAYYGNAVNKILSKNHKIDYKNMNYKDYEDLVQGAYDNYMQDYSDPDNAMAKYIADKLKKK